MDSQRLSARLKQPGHDRTFLKSETSFVEALRLVLPARSYQVVDHPPDLRKLLGGRFGIVPEASIEFLPKRRKMYFEVKNQGKGGNADERACKHHTVQFYKTLRKATGFDYHAFVTVMCGSLAKEERYVTKHPFYFEDDHYFNWVDFDVPSLKRFIDKLRSKYLEVDEVRARVIPK